MLNLKPTSTNEAQRAKNAIRSLIKIGDLDGASLMVDEAIKNKSLSMAQWVGMGNEVIYARMES